MGMIIHISELTVNTAVENEFSLYSLRLYIHFLSLTPPQECQGPPPLLLLYIMHGRWQSPQSQYSLHLAQQNTDSDLPPSPCSDSSVDEDEINCRMKPFWPRYQVIFKQRGFQLDTLKDVKLFYNQRSQNPPNNCLASQKYFHQDIQDDDSLCPDAGLVC